MSAELPLIGLEPPPGSERVQYRLLEEWGTGRAVKNLDELVEVVAELLSDREKLDAMRLKAREHNQMDTAALIAEWVLHQNEKEMFTPDLSSSMIDRQSLMSEELIESRL